MKAGTFSRVALVMVAATIGSGVFALPYIFHEAGWLLCLLYFGVIALIVSYAHTIYLRTLEAEDGKERLLGLAKKYFGAMGFWVGFAAIVVGLLLSFVAYLILGTQFVRLIFPAVPQPYALAAFWIFISAPVFLRSGRVVKFETIGVVLVALIVLFVFVSGAPGLFSIDAPLFGGVSPFLPFGAVLFALAGWTAIEQAYEIKKDSATGGGMGGALLLGTILAACIYIMFAAGILASATHITTDTISGLLGLPAWKRDLIAVFGLFALWDASMPISREILHALDGDLGWNPMVSRFAIVGLPLLVVVSGFHDFLMVIAVAGGVFLSTQYLLIVSVGRRALALTRREKIILDVVAAMFVCAAVYSVYSFIVK